MQHEHLFKSLEKTAYFTRILTRLHIKRANVVEVVLIELSTKDVHGRADDTGSMRMAWGWKQSLDGGLVPLLAHRMEHVERVAALVLEILSSEI